jgi:hypothetical protein
MTEHQIRIDVKEDSKNSDSSSKMIQIDKSSYGITRVKNLSGKSTKTVFKKHLLMMQLVEVQKTNTPDTLCRAL